MTLTRKVMWKEGMFLRPHHFQQQDLRTETALAARVAAVQPFHWGFSRLEIDEGRLAAGQVGLAACAGAFPDGAPFAAPGDAAELSPAAIGGDVKGATVWLVAPSVSPGAAIGVNDQPGAAASARFAIREVEVADALKEGLATEPVELGALSLRLAVGDRPEGFDALPVARVLEVAQGRVKLDPDFVPPILHIAASARLKRACAELAARFDARASLLAGPLGVAGGLSAGANQQLMLLQLCNGAGSTPAFFKA